MKIIEQEHEIWGDCPSRKAEAVLWIERAGRVCYRSEDKIIEGSGLEFVNKLIQRKHGAMVEHSNEVLRTTTTYKNPVEMMEMMRSVMPSKYIDFTIQGDRVYIGGNYRAWMESEDAGSLHEMYKQLSLHKAWLEHVSLSDIPPDLRRITVEFVTDRAVTHELVRHRPCSFAQESQRYCSYLKELLFIKQWWWEPGFDWNTPLDAAENAYRAARKAGKAPEKARYILPNCTATRIVVTASLPEWRDVIFQLRCVKGAYPGMINLMTPVRDEFKERGWI